MHLIKQKSIFLKAFTALLPVLILAGCQTPAATDSSAAVGTAPVSVPESLSQANSEEQEQMPWLGMEAQEPQLPPYQIEELSVAGLGAPAGMCEYMGNIVVCDYETGCLLVLNKEGGFIRQAGKLGNGPDEYCQPTAVTTDGTQLFVLDAGNSRVQILDESLRVTQSIQMEELAHHQAGYRYTGIALDGTGGLYISSDSPGSYDAHIRRIDLNAPDKPVQKLERLFLGGITGGDGCIYAADTLAVTVKADGTEAAETGDGYIYKIIGDEWGALARRDRTQNVAALAADESGALYLLQCGDGALCTVGGAKIAQMPNATLNCWVLRCADGTFFLSDREHKALYRAAAQQTEDEGA